MALRKPTDSAPASSAAFESPEDDGDTTVVEAPAPAPTPAPTPSASRAVAAPAKTNVASPLSQATAMKSLQWAIPAADLEAMGFGVFPRITVGLDGFSRDKDQELGKRIKIAVLSWNPVWFVVTGEQNDNEANKLIRTSYDGTNLKGGEGTVVDYIAHLREEGYEKATSKQYVEVYANLLEYQDAKGNVVVVSEEDQEIIQVSLSPQSVGQWQRYMLESGLRKAKGIEDSNVVVMNQERKVLGSNKFGFATFSPK